MSFGLNVRAVACLRRIARAAEGIHEQLKYQNERSFPPINRENGGRKKTVITRGPIEDAKTEEGS